MQQELVGYLLGALGAEEIDDIEHALESCADTRRQLKILQRGLEPLDAGRGEVEIPAGLSVRTCQRIRETEFGTQPSSDPPASAEAN